MKKKDEIRHVVTSLVSIPITKMGNKGAAYQYATKPGMGVVEWYSAKDGYQHPVMYDRRDKTQRLRCVSDHFVSLYTKSGSILCIGSVDGLCKKDIPAQPDVAAIIIEKFEAIEGEDMIHFWAEKDMRIFVCYDDNGLVCPHSYLFRYGDYQPGNWDAEITFEDLYLPDSADINNTYRANIPGTWEYERGNTKRKRRGWRKRNRQSLRLQRPMVSAKMLL